MYRGHDGRVHYNFSLHSMRLICFVSDSCDMHLHLNVRFPDEQRLCSGIRLCYNGQENGNSYIIIRVNILGLYWDYIVLDLPHMPGIAGNQTHFLHFTMQPRLKLSSKPSLVSSWPAVQPGGRWDV